MTYVLFLRILKADFSTKKSVDESQTNGKATLKQSSGAQTKDSDNQSNGLVSKTIEHIMHSKMS